MTQFAGPLWHPLLFSNEFLVHIIYIQGVPGGMCQTSGDCSVS